MDYGGVLDRVARHLVDVHRTASHLSVNGIPDANGVAPDNHAPDVLGLDDHVGAEGVFGDEGVFGVVEELHVEGLMRVDEG